MGYNLLIYMLFLYLFDFIGFFVFPDACSASPSTLLANKKAHREMGFCRIRNGF